MKNLSRIERLERISQPGARNPLPEMELPELLSHIENTLELEPGSLPRSAEEASARGFDSVAGALADALGITNRELADWLKRE